MHTCVMGHQAKFCCLWLGMCGMSPSRSLVTAAITATSGTIFSQNGRIRLVAPFVFGARVPGLRYSSPLLPRHQGAREAAGVYLVAAAQQLGTPTVALVVQPYGFLL
eukprot:COSAG05_NODE_11405_length_515_cov_0.747596_1_plen_107_part_00